MKKSILSLVLVTILGIAIIPAISLAQPMEGCTLRHTISLGDEGEFGPGPMDETVSVAWGMFCLLDTVYTLTDWIFYVLVAVTGILVIWGGVTISMAAGDAEKMSNGKNYIMYAMMGLAVALLSKAVPSVVKSLLGAQ